MMNKSQFFVLIQFILLTILLMMFLIFPTVPNSIARTIGLLMIVAAFVLFVMALYAHQGVNPALPRISPQPNPDAELVERGIYRFIRHPFYTSVMSGVIGAALMHGHLAGLVVAAIICVFFTYKSFYEEGLLKETYTRYDDYRRRTGRFLPPLRRRTFER